MKLLFGSSTGKEKVVGVRRKGDPQVVSRKRAQDFVYLYCCNIANPDGVLSVFALYLGEEFAVTGRGRFYRGSRYW